MIASQKIGKSFSGALQYNLKKISARSDVHAEFLDSNFSSALPGDIMQEVALVRQLRPNLNNYVYHTSLNFLNDEIGELINEKLMAIAHDYLEAMGFANNQYLIFRHYDADHPHIHLLANRITFDGDVVSDSNNFKRSEQAVRALEYKYGLIPVEQSKYAIRIHYNNVSGEQSSQIHSYNGHGDNVAGYKDSQLQSSRITIEQNSYRSRRAPKKNEIEMAVRTGRPSAKMLLQEVLSDTLKSRKMSLPDFIRQCEAKGVHLLFNQASTGRISGITYFQGDFKAKGQSLGDQYKWLEVVKQLDYEQDRDSKAVSEANSRTRAIYGDFTKPGGQQNRQRAGGKGDAQPVPGYREDTGNSDRLTEATGGAAAAAGQYRERSLEAGQDADTFYRDAADTLYHDTFYPDISIADDVDDEAVYGKNRRKRGSGYSRGR